MRSMVEGFRVVKGTTSRMMQAGTPPPHFVRSPSPFGAPLGEDEEVKNP